VSPGLQKKRNVAIAWLDLKNGFGSILIDHLLTSMKDLGLSGRVVEVVKDIYTGSTTRIMVGASQSLVPEVSSRDAC